MTHIEIFQWENLPIVDQWIVSNSEQYEYIKKNIIDNIFSNLLESDRRLLADYLVLFINVLAKKLNLIESNNQSIFWHQLTQNNHLDMVALLGILLPYIINDEDGNKKKKLTKLENIYLDKDSEGKYTFSNSQYNRCIRTSDDKIIFRPYLAEYFKQHAKLLFASLDALCNKLYVNWVDIVPIPMNNYDKINLFKNTQNKLSTTFNKYRLYDGYIDMYDGISVGQIYNVLSNHFFHQIKNIKWLIYDVVNNNQVIPLVTYLDKIFDLNSIWQLKLWSQLDSDKINLFASQWNNLLDSSNKLDMEILGYVYFFFQKYHQNADQLVRNHKLIKVKSYQDDEEDFEDKEFIITYADSKNGIQNVPVDEIYLFMYDQLSLFKKTWYYYGLYKKKSLVAFESTSVTYKNIYNYCKSLTHFNNQSNNEYSELPKNWSSLSPIFVDMVVNRLCIFDTASLTNTRDKSWFNISGYISKIYKLDKSNIATLNEKIFDIVTSKISNLVFESLIYHGLLSEFIPRKEITDNKLVELGAGSKDDIQKTNYKRSMMKKYYFDHDNRLMYETDAYYFITGQTYGSLGTIKNKNYGSNKNYEKKYFDFLIDPAEQIWTFTYAMNWISQINFYNHYMNNRVIYVTGATGVGKSTQVPKLLLYCQKMLDYNLNGKIVCTQPRINPTVENADTISREMGIPIKSYDKNYDTILSTENYFIQFKHQQANHLNKQSQSFLKIVTDGTLLEEMKQSPFLSLVQKSKPYDYAGIKIDWNNKYLSGNIYDIIIVDEAHEHNTNMDIILTLARDSVYINNSLKLVIVSATMDDDEPIYRRYYRTINDNRMYPLSMFIENNNYDRANTDRRIHISPPGKTTQYDIKDIFLDKTESDKINDKNFIKYGIDRTIKLVNETTTGDILLFMSGESDIRTAIEKINANTPPDTICLGFFSKMSDQEKNFIIKIDQNLYSLTKYKSDVLLPDDQIIRRVPPGTYKRAIIVATNVAEASITLRNLKYVVDTGYAKINIYDPINNYPELKIMPISYSSSQQRKGRVGRVSSGEVYYMYDLDKVKYNKTSYKIAEEDIGKNMLGLLKNNYLDHPIVNEINDINNIDNLLKVNINQKNNPGLTIKDNVFAVMLNADAYLNIIEKQYGLIIDLSGINKIYTYYGVVNYDVISDNLIVDFELKRLDDILKPNPQLVSFKKYIELNHDDYLYQKSNKYQPFNSKGYTGYNNNVLEDQSQSFYLIHPDENIMTRDPYTGKIIGLKYNSVVDKSYYHYLFSINKLDDVDLSKIKSTPVKNIFLPKYSLIMQNALRSLLTVEVRGSTIPPLTEKFVKNPEKNHTDEYRQYYNLITQIFLRSDTIIKTTFGSKISEIASASNLEKYFYNDNIMLWYIYGLAYDIVDDILALIIMINSIQGTSINKIMEPVEDIKQLPTKIKDFINTNENDQGDIYFFWKLWLKIKPIIEKNASQLFIISGAKSQNIYFKWKNDYLTKQKMNPANYQIIDYMYKSGKSNVEHEYYNFMKLLNIDDMESPQKLAEINDLISIIAKNHKIDPKYLTEVVSTYVKVRSIVDVKNWSYEYEIKNNINNVSDYAKDDAIEWVKQHISLSNLNLNEDNQWTKILKSYIRAYSTNVIYNSSNQKYIGLNRGTIFSIQSWNKKINIEPTMLNSKTKYMIYNSIISSNNVRNVVILTPIKIEWVLEMNPIYYLYVLCDKKSKSVSTLDKNLTNDIIQKYSTSYVIDFLDKLNDPIFSQIIRFKINN